MEWSSCCFSARLNISWRTLRQEFVTDSSVTFAFPTFPFSLSCSQPHLLLFLALSDPTLLSFIPTPVFFLSSHFQAMKYSLVAALLAAASVSAHDPLPVHNARHLHLAERQNPTSSSSSVSPTSSSSSSSSVSSSVSSNVPRPTSGTLTQRPPSTITGAPGAIPIDDITSGMPSGTPDPATTTYSPGSRPTWSGAPPLPSPCTLSYSSCSLRCSYASI